MVMNKPIIQKQPIDADLGERFREELQQFYRFSQRELPAIKKQHRFGGQSVNQADHQAETIEEILSAFNTPARVIRIHQGPRVTQFNLKPERINGRLTKISAIKALDNDLSLALDAPVRISTQKVRLVLEIPNPDFEPVAIKSVVAASRDRGRVRTDAFSKIYQAGGLPLALGLDMTGEPVAADAARKRVDWPKCLICLSRVPRAAANRFA